MSCAVGCPVDIMAYFIRDGLKKYFVKLAGQQLIPSVPYVEGYFMEEAKRIQQLSNFSPVVPGGMNSMHTIEKAMSEGFQWIAMARALIENMNFINDLRNEVIDKSSCTICNYCVAKMYSGEMSCHLHEMNLPEELKQKIAALNYA